MGYGTASNFGNIASRKPFVTLKFVLEIFKPLKNFDGSSPFGLPNRPVGTRAKFWLDN